MTLAQGYPNSFGPNQQTQEVLHNLDNETKKIYTDVNGLMASNGHAHTGNGSDGKIIGITGGGTGAVTAAAALAALLSPTANKHMIGNAAGTEWEAARPYKTGTFSRLATAASSNQAITGVGFKPSAIEFWACIDSRAIICWGMFTENLSTGDKGVLTSFNGAWTIDSPAIALYETTPATGNTAGQVYSLDADGFTIAWTKTGSPTGSILVRYVAFR